MIVPEYWAEAKVRDRINGSQVTIRRFGWSDESEAAAQTHARERADEAMARARNGEKVRRLDHKLTYNGAEGLPIREEVVDRHGDVVITRNVYGALCLNTPDVLFADIDFAEGPGSRRVLLVIALMVPGAAAAGAAFGSVWLFIALCALGVLVASPIARVLHRIQLRRQGGPEEATRRQIEAWLEAEPEAHCRLYRTPMGYRVLVMHRTFDPTDEAAADLLKRLNSDPVYQRMCQNQRCFRARISPKPWRIGMPRMGPRPGVWPIRPERMPDRRAWIESYTRKAEGYAACRYERSFGGPRTDPAAEAVRALHDRYCLATESVPIA